MRFAPKRARHSRWINGGLLPPRCFIAGQVDLAMVTSTQWDNKLIADLAPKRSALCEAQVMGICGLTTTN
jgi:hypothetical protein